MSLFSRVPITTVQISLLVAAALFSTEHARAESIINGDFETGNVGFSSDYTYFSPPGSKNMAEEKYTVWTDPKDVHSKWTSIGDHTMGDGMMLIANGAGNSNAVLWHQEVSLTAGVPYYFSAWATGVYPSFPANLIFEIGGLSLGTLQLTETVPEPTTFLLILSLLGVFVLFERSKRRRS